MANPTTVAPHSLEAERAVLGAVLLSDQHLAAVRLDERLAAEDFYREQYGHVFTAMVTLHDEDRPIDVLTVAARMREQGHDVEPGLDDLPGWAPGAGHVREYARIVHDLALRRSMLTNAYEAQADALTGDRPVRELIERAELRMRTITDTSASDLAPLVIDEELARLEQVRAGVPSLGLQTGFVDLDRLTSGLHKGNLVILAARPSIGKSTLAMDIAAHVASEGHSTAVFSLEMSRTELLRRAIASLAHVPGDALMRGPISDERWAKLQEAAERIAAWPLYVDDGADVSVLDIRARARRLHARVGLALVIVDYVQLARGDGGAENRNVEVGKITRGLKVLAKELAVPVLALSQLSRGVESRQDKHPVLSDLRDSGSVEQDADLVWFLFRESVYDSSVPEPERTEVIIAKHRNGPTGKVDLTFLDAYPRFASYASPDKYS